jgi:hypothetical protein
MIRFAGPPCPQEREHGVLFDLPSGRWYCPHAGHVGEPFYTYDQLPPPWGSAGTDEPSSEALSRRERPAKRGRR